MNEVSALTPAQVIAKRRRRLADRADITQAALHLATLLLLLWVAFGVVFGLLPMPNRDMAPRLGAGDLLLYYRLDPTWNNNDVMVLEKDGVTYVGRIVARGGDTVEITEQASLVVNGSTVLESNIFYSTPRYDNDMVYPITLAQDEFFVLVDAREGGKDSRWYGPVAAHEVRGKVIAALRRHDL